MKHIDADNFIAIRIVFIANFMVAGSIGGSIFQMGAYRRLAHSWVIK
ncbi:hypothetical protein [Chromobacterium sp. ATCC 53434]|nr:hypothetical protein [Chromobacterium sp. ATCC 53434]